jgi:hypothetical protein
MDSRQEAPAARAMASYMKARSESDLGFDVNWWTWEKADFAPEYG